MKNNPRYANGSLRRKMRARLKAMGLPCHICGRPIHYDEPSDAKHPLSFVVDEIIPVTDDDAFAQTKAFAHKQGILVGISSGAALHAAFSLAERPENKGKTIVVLLPDTGSRYLSTGIFG